MTHAKNNKNKIKAYQNVAENEEVIALNYEIMQLYIHHIHKGVTVNLDMRLRTTG